MNGGGGVLQNGHGVGTVSICGTTPERQWVVVNAIHRTFVLSPVAARVSSSDAWSLEGLRWDEILNP